METRIDSKEHTKNLLDSRLDNLLDEFEGQFDLLNFENEEHFLIEYTLNKILTHFASDYTKEIEINFKEGFDKFSLITKSSPSEFEKHFEKISDICQKSINDSGLANTYISLGSIKYGDNIAPCLFIPVFIKKNQNKYVIFRNYNQEIQFNVLLKIVLKEDYGINLPDFDGDLIKIINKLNNFEGIEYQENAFVSNFDLRFNHIFLDLYSKSWNNFDEKFNQYNNEPIYNFNESKKFKQKLQEYANNYEIHDDYLFLKSLLSKNKSILVIGDKSIRNNVKNHFHMIDSDSLILEFSDDLSKEKFHEVILDNNLMHDTNVVNLDNLVKTRNQIKGIVKYINQNYSFLSPKQIKSKKDYYLNKINELQLKNFTCELNDVCDYDELTCKKMKDQILTLFSNKENIIHWYKYFSLNELNSNRFNSFINVYNNLEYYLKQHMLFNDYLNRRYSVKRFDNLFSVDILNNLEVLDKSAKPLNHDEIIELNNFIKDYYNDGVSSENKKLFDEIDNNVKYTELIDKGIIEEDKIDFIKYDFENFIKYTNYFVDFSNFLIKEFNYIFDFYSRYDFFDIDSKLLNMDNSIEDLKILLSCFKKHVDKLINLNEFLSLNVLNRDVEKIVEFIFENDFKENEISIIFWFNIYNSLLNKFLKDYDYIDEEKIISEYESELKDLEKKLNMHNQNLLIQKIYSKSIGLNNTQIVLNQKNEFTKDFPDNNNSIRDLLDKYKEFITANKRIFLMDIASVSQLLSNSYENYFDYVIITDDLKYDLDKLSLLLRSKNKIILNKGENHE